MKGRDSNCYSLQGDDYREGFFSLSLSYFYIVTNLSTIEGTKERGRVNISRQRGICTVTPLHLSLPSLSLYFSSIHVQYIHIHDALVQHLIIIIISSPSHRPTYDLLTHTYYIIIYSVVIKDLHQDCILYKCFFFLSYIIIAIYMEVNLFNLIRFSFYTKIHT